MQARDQAYGGYVYSEDALLQGHAHSREYYQEVPTASEIADSTLAVLPPSLIGERHLVQIPQMLLTAARLLQRQWTRDFFVTSSLPPGMYAFLNCSMKSKQGSGFNKEERWLFDLSSGPVKAEALESSAREKLYRPILTVRGSGNTLNMSQSDASIEFTSRTELEYFISNRKNGDVNVMKLITTYGTLATDGSSPTTRSTRFQATLCDRQNEDSEPQIWISEPLMLSGTRGVTKHGS